jgi:molybdopterin molybdotransferase
MISVKEATEKILSCEVNLKTVRVSILDSLGKILAENITASESIPAYDNSAMDGFAVRSVDIIGADKNYPVRLRLLREDIPAGKVPGVVIESGTAVQIMTGAALPEGCDCVVAKEDALKEGKDVFIFSEIKKGGNIRHKGEDIKSGSIIVRKGSRIFPGVIGVLASIGVENILVYKTPVVGILATGDELVYINDSLSVGKVRDSNSYSLASLCREIMIEYKLFGIVKDDRDVIREKILEALKNCDILLLTGGVSVGDYDFVKEILDDIGADFIFWRVNQRPGKPVAFLTYGDKFIFGLPGNPVSVMVCFEVYVRPLIKKMSGDSDLFRKKIRATSLEEYGHQHGRTDFIRVKIEKTDEGYCFRSTGMQGSGILTSMVEADGLAVFSETEELIEAGKTIDVILLKDI